MTDKSEWCLEGVLKEHRIIRKVMGGRWTTSYVAKDARDERVMLTYLEREKIEEILRYRAHQKGLDEGAIERDMRAEYERILEEHKRMVERIRGMAHRNVAETFGIGLDRGKNELVIISEYVPGLHLYDAVRGHTPLQAISLFVQAGEGLRFIHASGLLHFNLKPSRIRVDVEGIPAIVKLTDFGFALPLSAHEPPYRGTPLYMAPEVILEEHHRIDTRADIYGFGVTMYYCLTERHPNEHRQEAGHDRERIKAIVARERIVAPLSHYRRDIPAELERIIMGCLEPDADKRAYHSVKQLINAFYEAFPEESREMPYESTSTLVE